MHAELHISVSTLIAFVLVLARMIGVFVFVPLPFKDSGPSLSRVVLALGCTMALYSRWPQINEADLMPSTFAAWMISDAALGAAIGLFVSFIAEAFTVGAQNLALQAGYGYASVIDPTTQADSDVLAVLAQLLVGLFFFTSNLHYLLIQAFADSLQSYPPGKFVLTRNLAEQVIAAGSGIFSIGLRLSLPIIALLLMTEITLALIGRINSQLHLGMQSFPLKMLLTILSLSSVLLITPRLYGAYAERVFAAIHRSFLP